MCRNSKSSPPISLDPRFFRLAKAPSIDAKFARRKEAPAPPRFSSTHDRLRAGLPGGSGAMPAEPFPQTHLHIPQPQLFMHEQRQNQNDRKRNMKMGLRKGFGGHCTGTSR